MTGMDNGCKKERNDEYVRETAEMACKATQTNDRARPMILRLRNTQDMKW